MARLGVEMVPKTCWYSNVRSLLPAKEWNRLRKLSYEHAGLKCEICKGDGKDQGYRHSLECHEIWTYIESSKTQRLDGLVSLCPRCHMVKHIGRANAMGNQAMAFAHMEKVNEWSHKMVVNHIAKEYVIYKERSKSEWKIDLSILSEKFGVDSDIILESHKKPRITTHPWKKKRRRKKKR